MVKQNKFFIQYQIKKILLYYDLIVIDILYILFNYDLNVSNLESYIVVSLVIVLSLTTLVIHMLTIWISLFYETFFMKPLKVSTSIFNKCLIEYFEII